MNSVHCSKCVCPLLQVCVCPLLQVCVCVHCSRCVCVSTAPGDYTLYNYVCEKKHIFFFLQNRYRIMVKYDDISVDL